MNSIYFGVMFAMVVGLVANPIRNSALTRGDLTFKTVIPQLIPEFK